MKRTTKLLIIVAALLALTSCAKFHERMAWAYRALHWTALAGKATDTGIAAWLRAETQKCLKAHGTKTEGFAKCIKPTLQVVRKWTGCDKAEGKTPCKGGVLTSLQTAQKGALASLETAYNAGKGNTLGAVKPAICALADFVELAHGAGAKFGKADEAVQKLLTIAAAVCK